MQPDDFIPLVVYSPVIQNASTVQTYNHSNPTIASFLLGNLHESIHKDESLWNGSQKDYEHGYSLLILL